MTGTASGRMRLPFWRTVGGAFLTLGRNFGYVARISWAWALIMLPISAGFSYAMFRLGWHLPLTASPLGTLVANIGETLLPLPMVSSIAVAWHRLILLGERSPRAIYLRFDRTVVKYLALAVLIVEPPYLFALGGWIVEPLADVLPVDPSVWFPLLLVVAGVYFGTRFWFTLPAHAIGRTGNTLAASWSLTRGHTWRLIAGGVVCTLICLLFLAPTFLILPLLFASQAYAIQGIVSCYLALLLALPVVSFLSLAYRYIVEPAAITGPAVPNLV